MFQKRYNLNKINLGLCRSWPRLIMSPKQTKMASDGLKKKSGYVSLMISIERKTIIILPVKSFYVKIIHVRKSVKLC